MVIFLDKCCFKSGFGVVIQSHDLNNLLFKHRANEHIPNKGLISCWGSLTLKLISHAETTYHSKTGKFANFQPLYMRTSPVFRWLLYFSALVYFSTLRELFAHRISCTTCNPRCQWPLQKLQGQQNTSRCQSGQPPAIKVVILRIRGVPGTSGMSLNCSNTNTSLSGSASSYKPLYMRWGSPEFKREKCRLLWWTINFLHVNSTHLFKTYIHTKT